MYAIGGGNGGYEDGNGVRIINVQIIVNGSVFNCT